MYLDPAAIGGPDGRRGWRFCALPQIWSMRGTWSTKLVRGYPQANQARSYVRPAEAESLLHIVDRLVSNLRSAAALLATGDDRATRLMVEGKEVFRGLEAEATAAHSNICARLGWAAWKSAP
jgi:hypothetical protein